MRGSQFPLALLALLGVLRLAQAQEALEEPPPALVNPNPLSGLSLESLTATRSLPLFTPSRTTPAVEAPVEEEMVAAPAEPQAEPEAPPPDLQLIGIVLADSTQTALLRNSSTGEVLRLTSGDEVENWALKIVDARSVELRSGDRVQGLKMFETFPAPPSAGNMMEHGEGALDANGNPIDADGNPIPAQPFPEEPVPQDGMGDGSDPNAPATEAQPAVDFQPELGGAPIPDEGAPAPRAESDTNP